MPKLGRCLYFKFSKCFSLHRGQDNSYLRECLPARKKMEFENSRKMKNETFTMIPDLCVRGTNRFERGLLRKEVRTLQAPIFPLDSLTRPLYLSEIEDRSSFDENEEIKVTAGLGSQKVLKLEKWWKPGVARIEVDLQPWKYDESILQTIAKKCTQLKVINLGNNPHLTAKALGAFVTALRSTNQLNEGLSTLKHIDLSNSMTNSTQLECDAVFSMLVITCSSSLVSLELRNTLVSDKVLRIIGKQCSFLQFLDVSGCSRVTDTGLHEVVSGLPLKTLNTIKTKLCPNVRGRFFLSGPSGQFNGSRKSIVSPTIGISVMLHFCCIKYFDLSNCPKVTDDAINEISKSSTSNLTTLYLNNCCKISDVSIELLSLRCKSLRCLGLENCEKITDRSLVFLSNGELNGLISINLAGTQITDLGIKKLLYAHGNTLESIHIETKRNKALTGDSSGKMSIRKRKLDPLCGEWFVSTDKILEENLEENYGPEVDANELSLLYLNLSGQAHVSSQNIRCIVACARRLEVLDFSYNVNINADTVHSICVSCTSLRVLRLRECANLDDSCLLSISKSKFAKTCLQELDISCSQEHLAQFYKNDPEADIQYGGFSKHDISGLDKSITDRLSINKRYHYNNKPTETRTENQSKKATRISENSLLEILNKCILLERLSVRYHENFNDTVTESMNYNKAGFLNHVDAEGCLNLSKDGLSHLLSKAPNLSNLNLTHCTQIYYRDILSAMKLLPPEFRASLYIVESPYFGFQPIKLANSIKISRQFHSRLRLENTKAMIIQRQFRRFLKGFPTLEYVLIVRKEFIFKSAVIIQNVWRQYLKAKQAAVMLRVLRTVKILQRFFRCCLFRKRVYSIVHDSKENRELKLLREKTAARARLEWKAAKLMQKTGRSYIYWKSEEGKRLIKLQKEAVIELNWRRKSKRWREKIYNEYVLPELCSTVQNKMDRNNHFLQNKSISYDKGELESFETVLQSYDNSIDTSNIRLVSTKKDKSESQRDLVARKQERNRHREFDLLHSQNIATKCSGCEIHRAYKWCIMCRNVFCSTCIWEKKWHHHIRENDPEYKLSYEKMLITIDTEPLQIDKVTLLELRDESFRRAKKVENALGSSAEILHLRRQYQLELVEYVRNKVLQKEREERERVLKRQKLVEKTAIVLQRHFRLRIKRGKARESIRTSLITEQTVFDQIKFKFAVRIQATFRRVAPRRKWIKVKETLREGFPGHRIDTTSEQVATEMRNAVRVAFSSINEKCFQRRVLGKLAQIKIKYTELDGAAKLLNGAISQFTEILDHRLKYMRVEKSAIDSDIRTQEISSNGTEFNKAILEIQKKRYQSDISRTIVIRSVLDVFTSEKENDRALKRKAHKKCSSKATKKAMNHIKSLDASRKAIENRFIDVEKSNLEQMRVSYKNSKNKQVKLIGQDRSDDELKVAIKTEREWLQEKIETDVAEEIQRWWIESNNICVYELQRIDKEYNFMKESIAELKNLDTLMRVQSAYAIELNTVQLQRCVLHYLGDKTTFSADTGQLRKVDKEIMLVGQADDIQRKTVTFFANLDKIKAKLNKLAHDTDMWRDIFVTRKSSKKKRVDMSKWPPVGLLPPHLRVQHHLSASQLGIEIETDAWTANLPAGYGTSTEWIEQHEDLHTRRLNAKLLREKLEREKEEALAEEERQRQIEIKNEAKMNDVKKALKQDKGELIGSIAEDFLPLHSKTGATGQATRRKTPGIKERFLDWWNKNKLEEERMERSIKNAQKKTTGVLEGISELKLTFGAKQEKEMEKEQKDNAYHGRPIFIKFLRNLGKMELITLWYKLSVAADELITDLVLSFPVKNHRYHVKEEDMRREGYVPITHNKLHGKGSSPGLIIWTKRDPMKAPIVDLRLSFSDDEERMYKMDDFEQVNIDLDHFRLAPKTYIWLVRSDFDKPRKKPDIQFLERKVNEYKKLIEEFPDKVHLLDKLKEAELAVTSAKMQSGKADKDMLQQTVEFLGLSKKEVKKLMKLFVEMDTDASGEVDVNEFMSFIGIERTEFTDKLFNFLDKSENGSLDFPEFVNVLGTYCMFGPQEILQMVFSFMDTGRNGYVVPKQVWNLLVMFYEIDPYEDQRLSKCFEFFKKNSKEGKIKLEEFIQMHKTYPTIMFPAFHVRDELRRKFLGTAWWDRKLEKFARVRKKLKDAKTGQTRVTNFAKLSRQAAEISSKAAERQVTLPPI